MAETRNPELSVVVVIVSDTTGGRCNAAHLAGNLLALAEQRSAPPMEVIVPHRPDVEGIDDLRRQYPEVHFVNVTDLRSYAPGSREHHDELRARGLAVARGRIIALLEDHGIADPDWSARIVAAHRQECACVGGAIENGIDRPLNWSVYFCDFLRYQNPLPAGESEFASDANTAYKREALEAIRPVWEEVFHETKVNWALRSRGEKLVLAPEAIVLQHRKGLRLASALEERFIWGRSYAATRAGMAGLPQRAFWAAFSPLLPLLLLGRMGSTVLRKGRSTGAFLKALPLTALLLLAWSGGELTGYLTGRSSGASDAPTHSLARGSEAAG